MKVRITSAALLLALLASLAACGGEGNADITGGADDTSVTMPAETEQVMPDVEKTDYEGAVFNILAPEWGLYKSYFFADEQTGEVMNDAIYERERLVEEYLGVDIIYTKEGTIAEIQPKLQSVVMSGDDTYQLALTHCIQNLNSMVTGGLLYDWNTLPGVDLTREYWNQSCNENLSLFGKQYFTVSDYMLADPNAVLFNKEMIVGFELDDPYELVREGTWTIDRMFEMGSVVASDLNGDGMFDLNDRYGVGIEHDWIPNSFLYSSGLHLVSIREDGTYQLDFYNDKMVSLVEKFYAMFVQSTDATTYEVDAPFDEAVKMPSGRVLFQIESLNEMGDFRDCVVDFGILPYPKLEESQDGYITNDWSGLMAIPCTVGNPKMVGEVCEMLAFYSGDTTVPAYYDLLLGEKLSRDEDSKEMLSIIYGGIVYDPGFTYTGFSPNVSNLLYMLSHMIIRDGSDAITSWYEKYSDGAQAELDAFIEAVRELE